MPFLFALSFLTRIPVPVKIEYDEKLPAKAMAYYPVVGLLLGMILITVDYLGRSFLPRNVVSSLLLIVHVYLTGGLHLDGFIDMIDGLFGGGEKERKIEIMHDSSVGSFGLIGVVLLFLLKYSILVDLTGLIRVTALFLMPVVSRWLVVFSAWKYPVLAASNLAKSFISSLSLKQVMAGFLWLIVTGIILTSFYNIPFLFMIFITFCAFLIANVISLSIYHQLGGLNGDIYGAINEISEVVVLLTALIYLGLN